MRARRLLAVDAHHRPRRRRDHPGRARIRNERAGGITQPCDRRPRARVGVKGPPGIGKSRITREAAAIAESRGVDVVSTYCESHSSEIPFHAVAGLLRGFFGVDGLAHEEARAKTRATLPDADPQDLLLLDDLLGIGDTEATASDVDPDARGRRLATLLNAALLARREPAVYVIEDAHWIDAVSESMLADFISAVAPDSRTGADHLSARNTGARSAQSPSRPRYRLMPLDQSQASALTVELLGTDPSVTGSRRGSPSAARATRSSPRRSCATSPSAMCSTATAAHISAEATPMSPCPPPCRPPSPPVSTASARRPNAH